ncbi:unnamed protein product, partial [Polarella glacialis]
VFTPGGPGSAGLGFQLCLCLAAALSGMRLAESAELADADRCLALAAFAHALGVLVLPALDGAPRDLPRRAPRRVLAVDLGLRELWPIAAVAAALGLSFRHLGSLDARRQFLGDPPQHIGVVLLMLAGIPGLVGALGYAARF